MKGQKQLMSSNSAEWYTPPKIVSLVVQTLGEIDLDPCSNEGEPNVPARQHYTKADDGLFLPWSGRVYMNPPYGRQIEQWTGRLVNFYRLDQVTEAIALVPARTDTQWFQPLYDFPICFVEGRLIFLGAEDGAPFPSALAYMGPHPERFIRVFSAVGTVVRRACG